MCPIGRSAYGQGNGRVESDRQIAVLLASEPEGRRFQFCPGTMETPVGQAKRQIYGPFACLAPRPDPDKIPHSSLGIVHVPSRDRP